MRYLDHFEKIAEKRIRDRHKHRYYWNDITFYCNYFSHETFSVLEVGCGTGELLNNIRAAQKTGIDYSPTMIAEAKKQFPQIDFQVMAAENISLEEKYDLIILSNLTGYLEDVQAVLEQLKKVCHERTKIIVSYHNHLWEPFLRLAENLGLKTKTPQLNWLTSMDVRNLLFLAGFDCYRESRRMLLPINIPLLSPLINKFIAKLPLFRLMCINTYSVAKPLANATEDVNEKYSVSIVIPARNESGNIENGLLRIPKFGKWQEVIFIEGNSTDDTWTALTKFPVNMLLHIKLKLVNKKAKEKTMLYAKASQWQKATS